MKKLVSLLHVYQPTSFNPLVNIIPEVRIETLSATLLNDLFRENLQNHLEYSQIRITIHVIVWDSVTNRYIRM